MQILSRNKICSSRLRNKPWFTCKKELFREKTQIERKRWNFASSLLVKSSPLCKNSISGNNHFRRFSSPAACDGVYGIHLPEFEYKPRIEEDLVHTQAISASNHPLNCLNFLISFRNFKCDKAGITNIRFKIIRKFFENFRIFEFAKA